ncbi:hypothetical protein AAK967_08550 [Atopobiaceae bacterium 24-176]
MAATATVAARLEPELKERADVILEQAHISSSTLIRRMYEYVVFMGDVPEFVKTNEYEVALAREDQEDPLEWLRHGPLAELIQAADFSSLPDSYFDDAMQEWADKQMEER